MPKSHVQNAELRAVNEKLVITAVRQQELTETALKSGELYRLLAENFPNGMVLLFDQYLRHILAGGSALLALGFSKEALEGQTIWEIFSPQVCQQIEPAYRAALAGKSTLLEVLFPVVQAFEESFEEIFGESTESLARTHIYQVHALPILNDKSEVLIGMAVAQDVTEQRQAEEKVRWQAYHDPLTRLPNRVLLLDRLERILAMSKRSGEIAALLFLDLDHFKQINDTLGHAAGDRLLQVVALRLTGCLRAEDTVARIGGDEFIVLLPGLHAAEDATLVLQKITALLAEPILIDGHEMSVSASVGISLFPDDGQDAGTLLKRADAAMYQAKRDHKASPRSDVDSGTVGDSCTVESAEDDRENAEKSAI
jgi:diguanylate cyclase (GGDEF)-like protein/PAS domain S-box-containing protein